jgi:hypothetical protein
MRTMQRTQSLAAGAIVWTIVAVASNGLAQTAHSEPINPETRVAVRKIFEAKSAERRRSDAFTKIGQAVRELRASLRGVVSRSDGLDGAKDAKAAKEAAIRIRTLLKQARRQAAGEPRTLQRLEAIERRVDELVAETTEIERGSGGSRQRRARELVAALDASEPRAERLNSGKRRDSAWRTRTHREGER